MDWFEKLFGFREDGKHSVRSNLAMDVDGQKILSRANGRSFGAGSLELASLQDLRNRVEAQVPNAGRPSGRIKTSVVTGDVRQMHSQPEYAEALFQVASQFNLLEMPSHEVTPEQGITNYEHDHTQGPACALAAAAATVYRNYFAPVGGDIGQSRGKQLNGLADLSVELGRKTGVPVDRLMNMRNGYALCTSDGLLAISGVLAGMDDIQKDNLRGLLRIGLHRDVEVTDCPPGTNVTVSQAFCSALPVAYSHVPAPIWEPFASLVLECAYEATLLAAVDSHLSGGSNIVLLTLLGGGAFGNKEEWIHAALRRALTRVTAFDLDVRLVTHKTPTQIVLNLMDKGMGLG